MLRITVQSSGQQNAGAVLAHTFSVDRLYRILDEATAAEIPELLLVLRDTTRAVGIHRQTGQLEDNEFVELVQGTTFPLVIELGSTAPHARFLEAGTYSYGPDARPPKTKPAGGIRPYRFVRLSRELIWQRLRARYAAALQQRLRPGAS